MRKREAKQRAQEWLSQKAGELPGLKGAYLSGSFLERAEEAEWPRSSDLDLVLVFETGKCPGKIGKFKECGVLLEATCIEETEFTSPERVLATHYLAYAMNAGEILLDSGGFLRKIHRETAAHYADTRWVNTRCRGFLERIRMGVEGFDPSAPFPQQVNAWLFPTGIACFPILSAALENCTVRKRYPAARRVLERYGMAEFYPRLLALLVPRPLCRETLFRHLEELERTFRLACASQGKSASYAFRSDISPAGEAAAIGGSRELLLTPHPEDAVFWMAATFARCHLILLMDGSPAYETRLPAFRAFLAELGIRQPEDFLRRGRGLLAFLPELERAAGEIMARREGEACPAYLRSKSG